MGAFCAYQVWLLLRLAWYRWPFTRKHTVGTWPVVDGVAEKTDTTA